MRIGKKVVWVGGRMGRGHWADCVPFVGSYENEDLRHPPPPPTKTKTHHENEDTLLKQVQKRLVLHLWTKIMSM